MIPVIVGRTKLSDLSIANAISNVTQDPLNPDSFYFIEQVTYLTSYKVKKFTWPGTVVDVCNLTGQISNGYPGSLSVIALNPADTDYHMCTTFHVDDGGGISDVRLVDVNVTDGTVTESTAFGGALSPNFDRVFGFTYSGNLYFIATGSIYEADPAWSNYIRKVAGATTTATGTTDVASICQGLIIADASIGSFLHSGLGWKTLTGSTLSIADHNSVPNPWGTVFNVYHPLRTFEDGNWRYHFSSSGGVTGTRYLCRYDVVNHVAQHTTVATTGAYWSAGAFSFTKITDSLAFVVYTVSDDAALVRVAGLDPDTFAVSPQGSLAIDAGSPQVRDLFFSGDYIYAYHSAGTNGPAFVKIQFRVEAPILFGVSGPAAGENTLSWPDVVDATSYNLYWSLTPGVTTSSNKITGATSPYAHSGLDPSLTYYYAATSGSHVESELSNEVTLSPAGVTETSGEDLVGRARLSIFLSEEIDAFDVLSQINAAVGSYLFNDHQGKYRYVTYSPPTGASVPQFTEDDIFSFSEAVDATSIVSRVKSKYQHRVTQDYWQVRFVENPQAQYLQRSAVPILKEIESPFVQTADGLSIAQRTALHEGVPQRIYKCRVSSKGWTLLPSDFVQVTYARHGINGVFEVLETKRDLKTGQVDLVIGGLRGIVSGGLSGGFGYPGHWCAEDSFSSVASDGAWTDVGLDGASTDTESDGAETEPAISVGTPLFPASLGGGPASPWDPDWTDAQKAYAKQNFGYWTDEDGFADPTDPESFRASVWA